MKDFDFGVKICFNERLLVCAIHPKINIHVKSSNRFPYRPSSSPVILFSLSVPKNTHF